MASREIKDAARALVEEPDYVASLKQRLVDGKAPHMETLLFHYAYGKPKETTVLENPDGTAVKQIINNYAVPAPSAGRAATH